MAMTREEMQRLASYGRGGDTMLAHINPQEAALLKASGGSGTINPDTGLPEYRFGGFLGGGLPSVKKQAEEKVVAPAAKVVEQVAAPVVKPVEKAAGQVTSNLANLPGSVENTVKQVAANPVAQLALAYYMPGISASLAPYMVGVPAAYQTAVASALASTAIQTAQGVPFEQALKSATINAVTSTGAPVAAIYVEDLVGNRIVADALTSIGASAAKTAAMGGTKDDIEKNMVAALTGSGLTSALQAADVSRDTSRVAGAAAGGAVVGGTTGAITGAAGELGSQAARDAAKLEAQKGTKLAAAGDGTMTDAGRILNEVTVIGEREPDPTLQDTNIISPDVSTSKFKAISPPTAAKTAATADEAPPAKESPVDDKGVYNPNLFIFGGVKPKGKSSTLSASLGTQAPFFPQAGTSAGLTSSRGAGEIESKETGKARRNVWNEASLRLKDALGV